jgi:hypothetical protein
MPLLHSLQPDQEQRNGRKDFEIHYERFSIYETEKRKKSDGKPQEKKQQWRLQDNIKMDLSRNTFLNGNWI